MTSVSGREVVWTLRLMCGGIEFLQVHVKRLFFFSWAGGIRANLDKMCFSLSFEHEQLIHKTEKSRLFGKYNGWCVYTF